MIEDDGDTDELGEILELGDMEELIDDDGETD